MGLKAMGLNHGLFTKRGASTQPDTPKTILGRNFAYKIRTKTVELPK